MQKIIFIGAGGYAKSVLDSLDKNKFEFCGFIDTFKTKGSVHLGYPIIENNIENFEERNDYVYFISIGDNVHRTDKFLKLQKLGCQIVNIFDKTALISNFSEIGAGVFIGKMAIVNSNVIIGDNVIINTKALIEHGSKIERHSNISTNVTINGDVIVEQSCFIGSSSVITGQLKIGANAIVGAGAVVIRNVKCKTVVVGVPAKFIKEVC